MGIRSFIKKRTHSLSGKTIALSGPTGGIGRSLCFHLAELGADLVFLDRNKQKSDALRDELLTSYPSLSVIRIPIDMEDPDSVICAAGELKKLPIDAFICNAGAYSIPRKTCKNGYDNVFQINFISHYTLIQEILPLLRERQGRVVAVGSIAHNYSKSDKNDVDFSTRKQASLVYGNSKRYLTYVLSDLFDKEDRVGFAVAHPGITFTNITAHYPKLIFAIIKYPMKVIFPSTKKASLPILYGLFEETGKGEWIGPGLFNIWGLPKKSRLPRVDKDELNYFASFNKEPTFAERKKQC